MYIQQLKVELDTEARALDTVVWALEDAARLTPSLRSDAVRRQIRHTAARAAAEASHLRYRARSL